MVNPGPAPEIQKYLKRSGADLESTSDAVDAVNEIKGKVATGEEIAFDAVTNFDNEKDKTQFRKYEEACDRVKNFYREQHEKQTVEYNVKARLNFKQQTRAKMGVWEAMEMLNTLVDESDPDTSVSQIDHLLQSAEAIKRDGKPEWMQVAGLVHDLGKLLYFFGADGQWDVVGDTFVVGCAFPNGIVYPDTFKGNPDSHNPEYNTECGIYTPHCGLENLMLSWGHDEYLYLIFKNQSKLPQSALNMIRYHSFYPWHREGEYRQFMVEEDYQALNDVLAFNPYDLYSKSDNLPKVEDLKPYYMGLINKYFPDEIEW